MSFQSRIGRIGSGAALVGVLLLAPLSGAFAITTTPSTSGPSDAARAACKQYTEGTSAWTKCIKAHSSNFKDEDFYWAGYTFAKAGSYGDALEMLARVENKQDVRVVTMIGYATRKSGRIDEGIRHYFEAIALDPNYVEVREYLGEAYLQKGDLASAKAELTQIEQRCGSTCESYTELAKQIGAYESHEQL